MKWLDQRPLIAFAILMVLFAINPALGSLLFVIWLACKMIEEGRNDRSE